MALESSPAKLAVGATLKAAFKAVFGNLGLIIRAALLPLAVSLMLSGLTYMQMAEKPKDELPSSTTIALLALQLVPFAFFAGAVSRLSLSDPAAQSAPASRLGVQLFYVICFTIFFAVVSIPFGFAVIGMLPMILMRPEFAVKFGLLIPLNLLLPWHLYLFPFGQPGALFTMKVVTNFGLFLLPLGRFMTMVMVWTLPYYLLVLPVMARLSLMFPALSLNRRLDSGESWRLSRGNGLRLCAVLLAIAVLAVLSRSLFLAVVPRSISFVINSIYQAATGSPIAASLDGVYYWSYVSLTHVGELLLLYLGIALTAAALTVAYKRLSGWPQPGPG